MKITITCERTERFITAHAIATGSNLGRTFNVSVDAADLSQEAREFLVRAAKSAGFVSHYRHFRIPMRLGAVVANAEDGLFISRPVTDYTSDPTPAALSVALLKMRDQMENEWQQHVLIEAERKEAQRLAQQVQEELNRKQAEARELLKDELQQVDSLRQELKLCREIIHEISRDDITEAVDDLSTHDDRQLNSHPNEEVKRRYLDAANLS